MNRLEEELPDRPGRAPETDLDEDAMTDGAASRPFEDEEDPRPRRRARRSFGVMDAVWFLPRLLYRFLFWKLLDRYVIGELIGPLLFGWTMFIVLFVMGVNLYKLAQMAAAGAPLPTVAELLALRVVLSSSYCLPMAMLLAGLMAFGRLSGDSELVAMQAGGIRNLRVIWNAFLLGLALSFVGLALNEYVVPPAGRRLHHLEDVIKVMLKGKVLDALTDEKAFIIQDFEHKQLARLVAARKFEPANPPSPDILRDVTYIQYDNGKVEMIVEAKWAEYLGPDKDAPGTIQWDFHEATVQLMWEYTQGKTSIMASKELPLTLNKSPRQVQREQKDADQMTYRELKSYIKYLKANRARGKVVRELEVELERKLSIPFAAVVLALIGATLGIRRQRSTAGVGIGLSLLIIIVYYVGMSFLGVLGQTGKLWPLEAAWGCNIAGLVVGLFLTWRSA
jgi:lipopolysaccharide export system permease protein